MSGIPRRALQAGGVVAAAALVLGGCLLFLRLFRSQVDETESGSTSGGRL